MQPRNVCKRGHDKPEYTYCKICKIDRDKLRRATPEYKRKERDYGLRRDYGKDLDWYERQLVKQQGACSICLRKDQQLWVDHNHETDEVRELLCRDCNFAFGLVHEDVEIMKRMIEYADRHGAGSERKAQAA